MRFVKFESFGRLFVCSQIAFLGVLIGCRPASAELSQWKFVENGGMARDAGPAIMQVADFSNSHPNIAGLMFRCNKGEIESLVPLIEPVPPRSVTHVTYLVGTFRREFVASTISTGAGLLVPFDPRPEISGSWRRETNLTLSVDINGAAASALIHLDGLASALATLSSKCLKS